MRTLCRFATIALGLAFLAGYTITFLEALPRVQHLNLEGIYLNAQGEDDQVEFVF